MKKVKKKPKIRERLIDGVFVRGTKIYAECYAGKGGWYLCAFSNEANGTRSAFKYAVEYAKALRDVKNLPQN